MVIVWGHNENLIILNVGVLLLFGRWMVRVRCNSHYLIDLLFLNLDYVLVS